MVRYIEIILNSFSIVMEYADNGDVFQKICAY
jgi:NIMA (never in mitosis gene a)-related kinase 1/4/5